MRARATGLALELALGALACEARTPPRSRPRPPPHLVDAGAPPTTVTAGTARCALRASPPEDLSVGPGRSPPVVTWNGEHYGVAWSELHEGTSVVMFVRVGEDGSRLGTSTQVSEPGYQGAAPTLAWNGAGWTVIYEGGVRQRGDLYQARLDARGLAVGRPWRMTRGRRDDLQPALIGTGRGFGLAWVAREPEARWSLYAQVFDRWDAPLAPPARLLYVGTPLSGPQLQWTGRSWAVTCLQTGREVLAVDFARLEANGRTAGPVSRLTRERPGGTETEGRHAFAWDGNRYAAAWSELRDGSVSIFVRYVSPQGQLIGSERRISEGHASTAVSPALERVGDGLLALANQYDAEASPRVRVRVLSYEDPPQVDPVQIQGVNGMAQRPALAWSGTSLGVATVSPRGVSFHRVVVGPCER